MMVYDDLTAAEIREKLGRCEGQFSVLTDALLICRNLQCEDSREELRLTDGGGVVPRQEGGRGGRGPRCGRGGH